jgi:cation transport regulator
MSPASLTLSKKRAGLPSGRAYIDGYQRRRPPMPYEVNADLPPSVRAHLPEHAQDIFREAFNHAYAAHAHDPRQEEAAFRIAWAAVKREYEKVGAEWVEKG